MKRLWLLIGIILIGLCTCVAACGEASDSNQGTSASSPASSPDSTASTPGKSDVITLSFALFQPEVSPISQANIAFARELEARTNNRVKINITAGGSLLGGPAMFQGVIDGVADMGNGSTVYDPGAFPFSSIAELPCLAQSGWAASLAYFDLIEKYNPPEWQEVKILTVASGAGSFNAIGVKGKEIKTKDDWKGVSLRSMDSDIVSAMGATAKDLPMSEAYDAISKGVIDGTLGHVELFKTWRLGEVVDWVAVKPGGLQFSSLWYNIINKKTWDSLPDDIKAIFEEVGREHSGKIGLAWDGQAVAGVEFIKEQGKTLYLVPEEEAAVWDATISEVVQARLKKLLNKLGMTQEELDEAWNYFQDRVEFWNEAQETNGVIPVARLIEEALQK
jgi:TRAP-type C4-dicarboxylate transport system substrate-binding protein